MKQQKFSLTASKGKNWYVVVVIESLSHVQLFVTPWTVARQASLSMGFPRQEYWSELQFPSPEDFPDPGKEHASPAWQADSLSLSHLGSPKIDIITFLSTVALSNKFDEHLQPKTVLPGKFLR